MNYAANKTADGNITYGYKLIGQWASGNLTMFDDLIYWPRPIMTQTYGGPIKSVCSDPCRKGQKKVRNGFSSLW